MSELKCPFCGQTIVCTDAQDANEYATWLCPRCIAERNWYAFGNNTLWQELIRTRKALDVAWDGLEKIGSGNIIEHSVVGHEDDNKIFIANKALDESKTALEQKDK